jgi:hypothetical protein
MEQNLFGAKDGRAVELFQENNGFFQKLCDLQAAVCHVVSVVCERGGVRQSPLHLPHAHFTPARQSCHAILLGGWRTYGDHPASWDRGSRRDRYIDKDVLIACWCASRR